MRRTSPLQAEPIREYVGKLATTWASSYVLRGDDSWWYFDPSANGTYRRQGWKLHVSAIPVEAPETLRQVARVTMPYGLRWKVTRTIQRLGALCAPPSPLSQVGKFVTIYPDDQDGIAELAAKLHEATALLTGPVIPSDIRFRPGSNVYLRYGAFEANGTYEGIDQTRTGFLVDPDGRRVPDNRAPGMPAPAWIQDTPAYEAPRERANGNGPGLFGRDIEVLGVLRQSAKGGVYRANWHGEPVVLKEARIGTCADLLGRDARTRLLNEWRILRRLKGTGLVPDPLDFFFEESNAYLVEDLLPGTTLRQLVEDTNYRAVPDTAALLRIYRRIPELVERVRAHGVVVRDLTPNNIMVDGDRFALIDLELCDVAGSAEPRFDGWTPGYALPQRDRRSVTGKGSEPAAGRGPEAAELEHALAAIAHFVLTGIDPHISRSVSFAGQVDAVLKEFGPPHADLAAAELGQVRSRLGGSRPSTAQPAGPDQILTEAVDAGVELVRRVDWDTRPWPWPRTWAPGSMHPASFDGGIAGIAAYYLDLCRATGDRIWLRHARDLLGWTFETFPFVPGQSPPGLHFGLGALPWLMAELASVDATDRTLWRNRASELAGALAESDAGSWDLTHGHAGIGLTELAVLRLTGDTGCRIAAGDVMRCVQEGATEVAGLPVWPRGDRVSYGFAHGSAGIGYFLLSAGVLLGDAGAIQLATTIGQALLGIGVPVTDGRGLSWPHSPGFTGAPWTHWCNGAAGVGTFLLELWQVTGVPAFHDAAVRAGRAITLSRAFGSCCRCHGLAGDGDYLLDLAADSEAGEEFRAGAARIGRKLDALRFQAGTVTTWAHEGDGESRPGFMRGFTGIHSFRLRLAGHIEHRPLLLPALDREEKP